MDTTLVKSIMRFIKTSAREMSSKIRREEVERLVVAEEAEEIVEGVIAEVEAIEVEEEDAVVRKGTPEKISIKKTSSPLPNQCKEKNAWEMLRILKTRFH